MKDEPLEPSLHATAPLPWSDETSVWPAIAGVGVVLAAAALVIQPWLALAGVAVAAFAAAGATREVSRAHAAPGPHASEREGPPEAWARAPSKHAWLAAGLAAASLMVFVAVGRALMAYGLLDPEEWPPGAPGLVSAPTFAMTALAPAALAALWWARRAALRGERRLAPPLVACGALVGGFLAAVALEAWRVARAGLYADASHAGSAYYALLAYFALNALGVLAYLGAMGHRARLGQLRGEGAASPLAAVVVFWVALAAVWTATFLVLHLRLLTPEGQNLLDGA